MHIKRKGRAWFMPEYKILSGANTLRNLQINDSFKYLGATFSAAKGLDNSENTMKISETAERCKRLKLKPLQKLDLLCKYILPAMYHLLFTDLPSNNTLNQLDQIIKRTARLLSFTNFHLRRACVQ